MSGNAGDNGGILHGEDATDDDDDGVVETAPALAALDIDWAANSNIT